MPEISVLKCNFLMIYDSLNLNKTILAFKNAQISTITASIIKMC